jgi:hypothetical protein
LRQGLPPLLLARLPPPDPELGLGVGEWLSG